MSGVFLFTLALLAMSYTYLIYESKVEVRKEAIPGQAIRMSQELQSSFDYVTYLMKFLGEQIVKHDNPNDIEHIAALLQGNLITNESMREQFSWLMFDWNNPQKKMLASTSFGIMKTPKTVEHRLYAKMAPLEPWVLHFDNPDVGISSGKWIIPAGMGITNRSGQFIGSLSMGFSIEELTKRVQKASDVSGIRFMLINRDFKNVLGSLELNNISKEEWKDFIKNLPAESQNSVGGEYIPEKKLKNVIFNYRYSIDGTTYILLIGYDTDIASQEFKELLLPGIIGYFVLGITSLILLFAIYRTTILPIVKLSKIADQIAAGQKLERIPRTLSEETNNLSRKLLKLQRVMHREGLYKKELSSALDIIDASDNARADFIRQMRSSLTLPLKAILNGAIAARDEKFGKLDIRTYKTCFDAIYDAGKQLESYTTQFLEINDVDISEVATKCVVILKRYALEQGIKLELNIQENLPSIIGDKVRLNQIILCTIYNSLLCLPSKGGYHTKVDISLEQRSDSPYLKWICIKVEDNGNEVDEEERLNIWLDYQTGKYENHINSIDGVVDVFTIDHLVDLHKGIFGIQYTKRVGATYTIWLPYLSRSEFDPISTHENNKKDTIPYNSNKNVILFPK